MFYSPYTPLAPPQLINFPFLILLFIFIFPPPHLFIMISILKSENFTPPPNFYCFPFYCFDSSPLFRSAFSYDIFTEGVRIFIRKPQLKSYLQSTYCYEKSN